ncbi:MAG TPA: SDR family NAD(P)-dependent oxidoreductase, partial [Marinilabiliaceae bacterium]|nr:SDR family NAD(P)-dependent oxidoreductase [Marinilabiliaceae bacterium]
MKYALVTGGSRGIGRGISIKLAADGYHVLINYRSNNEEAESTLSEIKKNGGSGELLKFDVSSEEDIASGLGGWIEKNDDKHIEVLVNNAGIIKDNLMVFMPSEDWSSVLSTNLNSFFFVTKTLLQEMLLKRNGRIINIV